MCLQQSIKSRSIVLGLIKIDFIHGKKPVKICYLAVSQEIKTFYSNKINKLKNVAVTYAYIYLCQMKGTEKHPTTKKKE